MKCYVIQVIVTVLACTTGFAADKKERHLIILAGESGMVNLDEAQHFTPAVKTAFEDANLVVVKSAKEGQPIHRWYRDLRWGSCKQPKDAGILFADPLQRDIDKAISSHNLADADAFDTVTLIWMQGRSDAVEPHADAYLERLKGLVRQMRFYRKRHDLNVIIVRTNDHNANDPLVQMIRKAQVQAASELPRATWVDTDDLNGPGNDLSLTKDGYKTLGTRLAQKAIEQIKNSPKETHLFILSGQSNMYYMNERYFTPYVEALYGKRNVTVVKVAKCGAPIYRWYKKWESPKGEKGGLIADIYNVLIERVRMNTVGRTYDTVTFIWMQGESDHNHDWFKVYLKSLKGLVQQLADDVKRTDMNVVIGRINSSNLKSKKAAGWQMVREAQVKATKEIPRSTWIDTDDLWDHVSRVHMTKDGYRTMGERFAKAASSLISKQTGMTWDDRLAEMIPKDTRLPKDQRIAHVIDKKGHRTPSKGWRPIGTPGPETRQWRYMSLGSTNDQYTIPVWDAPEFKLISLPTELTKWYAPEFDDSNWGKGMAPIGCGDWQNKNAKVVNQSEWKKGACLLARTTFEVDTLDYSKFRISILCRLGNEVYLNGHRIRSYAWSKGPAYYAIPLDEEEAVYLRHGRNVLAVYAIKNADPKKTFASIDVDIEGYVETE